MKLRKNSVLADISFQIILILMFVAILFLAFDNTNLAVNGIILCVVTLIFMISYFTSVKVGFITNIIFVFLLVAYMVLRSINEGMSIGANVYFWIFWPTAMIIAITCYVSQHQKVDKENEDLVAKTEKYITIDELTQMNNLLGFERDAQVYMNISRRYELQMELVLWRLTYQEDLERLLGKDDLKKAIKIISKAIQKSLRKEDLIYLVDQDPYIWGTLMFSKPEAAQIVIDHVKEGVAKSKLRELTRQTSFSLEISGAIVTYDGSMQVPLAFLSMAKRRLWSNEYAFDVQSVIEVEKEVKKEGIKKEPIKKKELEREIEKEKKLVNVAPIVEHVYAEQMAEPLTVASILGQENTEQIKVEKDEAEKHGNEIQTEKKRRQQVDDDDWSKCDWITDNWSEEEIAPLSRPSTLSANDDRMRQTRKDGYRTTKGRINGQETKSEGSRFSKSGRSSR